MKATCRFALLGAFVAIPFSGVNAGNQANPSQCKAGGAPRAIEIAYQDFTAFLQKYTERAPENRLRSFLADIDNYEVRASAESGRYVVTFTPNQMHGRAVKGAGAKYMIDRCTFQIGEIRGRAPLD